MIEAHNINVRYGKKHILQGVDFTAKPKQVSAVVGPNGSGKTTLLKALTNEVPFDGDMHLHGQNLASYSPAELAGLRAVLPQSTRLAFPFNVLEVVRFGLLASRYGGRSDLPQRALERVGLWGFAERFYHELSGGEKQRVQLARVLVQVWEPVVEGKPCWLFLDEPVSALDIGHQLEVMTIARNFADAGGGVVAVMHDLNLTAMFADNVSLMQNGQIVARGTPGEVFTDAKLSKAYGCQVRTNALPPVASMPYLLPQATKHS